jgi:hypothetical protein
VSAVAIHRLDGTAVDFARDVERARIVLSRFHGGACAVQDGEVVAWAPGVSRPARGLAMARLRARGVLAIAAAPTAPRRASAPELEAANPDESDEGDEQPSVATPEPAPAASPPEAPTTEEETDPMPPSKSSAAQCNHPDGCTKPPAQVRKKTREGERGWCRSHRQVEHERRSGKRGTAAQSVATSKKPAVAPARAAAPKPARKPAPSQPAAAPATLADGTVKVRIAAMQIEIDGENVSLEDLTPTGLADVPPLGDYLFPFQRDLTAWALRRGRAAVFASTGLGKTRMLLAWADAVHAATGRDVLVLAPLSVAAQTAAEGARVGVAAAVCRDGADVRPGISVTNYDRLHRFDTNRFGAVVLDESSCIKHSDAKTFRQLTDAFAATPFRLACTATPAPNDWIELGTHAEFLGICTRAEMLAEFFVHDGGTTQDWRLKRHARGPLLALGRDVGRADRPAVGPRLRGRRLRPAAARRSAPHARRAHRGRARERCCSFAEPRSRCMERRAARRASLGARVGRVCRDGQRRLRAVGRVVRVERRERGARARRSAAPSRCAGRRRPTRRSARCSGSPRAARACW